jgi:undecaprenyl-diphosphatase
MYRKILGKKLYFHTLQMFEALKKIDEQLLLWGNSFHTDFLDPIMYHLTEFWFWIPLFAWWIFELYKLYGKRLKAILIYAIILVITTDQLANLIKNLIKRYRPTHNLIIQNEVHTVNNYLGGMFGFVSSHAANVSAIAVFVFLFIRNSNNRLFKITLFFWAIFICYTRIYLGVHYPLDLISGALLGTIVAILCYKIYYRYNR